MIVRPWIAGLLDKDSKALGVYLTLLYLRFGRRAASFAGIRPAEVAEGVIHGAKELLVAYLAGKPADAREAFEAGRKFVTRFLERESRASEAGARNRILEKVESEFCERFTKAFSQHLVLERLAREDAEELRDILLDVRSGIYREVHPSDEIAVSGTFGYYSLVRLAEAISKWRKMDEERVRDLLSKAIAHRIALRIPPFDCVIPAPSLSDKVLSRMVGAPPVPELVPPPPEAAREEFARLKPSKEVLEGIVAKVLEDLGFRVRTNVKLEARRGLVEADVWAQRRIAGTRFSVYASCKNWSADVGREFVDSEIGRIASLRDLPQLRVLVVKGLTDPARELAEASGFLTIELARKQKRRTSARSTT